MLETFKVCVTREIEVKNGYGVWFVPVWGEEEDDTADCILSVDAGVVRICPETVRELSGGELCVTSDSGADIPVDLFLEREDLLAEDTHDLRDRLFATEEEAQRHLADTLESFANPLPWQTFVAIT